MLALQKSFNMVDHYILRKKKKAMGIKSLDWFISYLSNRNQIVNVNDTESDPSLVFCGVHQGSTFHLLYYFHVNDMELSISSGCKLLLYTDHSAILYSSKAYRIISEKLGLESEMCSKWLVNNKLSLHITLLGSKRKLRKINNFIVECNVHTIKAQRSVKYFGLILDDQLTWGGNC